MTGRRSSWTLAAFAAPCLPWPPWVCRWWSTCPNTTSATWAFRCPWWEPRSCWCGWPTSSWIRSWAASWTAPHPARPFPALAGGGRPRADGRRLRPVHGQARDRADLPLGLADRLLHRLFDGACCRTPPGARCCRRTTSSVRRIYGWWQAGNVVGMILVLLLPPVLAIVFKGITPPASTPWAGSSSSCCPDLPAGHQRGRRDQCAAGQAMRRASSSIWA